MEQQIHPPQGSEEASRRPVGATSGAATNQSLFGWSSSNWSGYAVSNSKSGTYESVSAEWSVPSVKVQASTQPTSWWGRFVQWLQSLFGGQSSTSTKDSYSATWIGIDGFNDNSLIQAGTAQNVVGGHAQYYAWWEILPNSETTISTNEYPVSAGDKIIAHITHQTGGTWSIYMGNRTKGWIFQKTNISYNGPQTSAEWIEEAPLLNGQLAALADYGQVTFTNCSVNGTNPNLQVQDGGVMVQNGQQISTPSVPSSTADAFAVEYGSTQPQPPSA